MTRRVLFSEAARKDRRGITAYTVKKFGVLQARRLRDHFQRVIRHLANAPSMGRSKAELDPPGRTFRYFVALKSFIIVYLPTDDGITVVRILHGARSIAAELEADAEE